MVAEADSRELWDEFLRSWLSFIFDGLGWVKIE